jgi:hypothetical protein
MFSIRETLQNLLSKKETSSFDAAAAYVALDNKHESKQAANSLLCGATSRYADFLPSTTWGWFTSLT